MTAPAVVELASADGVLLRGQVWVVGEDWTLLLHDDGGDLDDWAPVAAGLAASGASVLAIDRRGHGGSEGVADAQAVACDVATGMAELARRGARLRVAIGAGAASWAALAAEGADAAAAVAPSGEPGALAPRVPRLVVSTASSDAAATALQAVDPALVVARVPVAAAGLHVLETDWGSNVEAYVVSFVGAVRRRVAWTST